MPILTQNKYEQAKERLQGLRENPLSYADDPGYGAAIEMLEHALAEYEQGATVEQGQQGARADWSGEVAPSAEEQELALNPEAQWGEIQRAQQAQGTIPTTGWAAVLGTEAEFAPQEDAYSLARARSINSPVPPDMPALPSQTSSPELYRPPRAEAQGWGETKRWVEPSVEQVREFLKPYLGAAAGHVTEDSEEYKRAADFMYSRYYDKAVADGHGVIRERFLPSETLLEDAKRAVRRGVGVAGGFGAGMLDAVTLGVSSRLSDWHREMQLHEPTAAGVGQISGLLSPTGAPGYIFRMLGKAGLRGGERAIGGAAGRLAGGGLGAGAASVVEGGARDVAETVGTDEFGGRMEALPETSFLRALGGFGLGAGMQGLSEAARGGAAGLRRSNEALDDALNYSEMRGSELSGFGKTRAPPVDAELRAAGRGFTAVDEASMRALEGVPSQGALVDSIGARIGDRAALAESVEASLPAVDQLAAKASGRLAVSGANRYADTQDLVERAKSEAMEGYRLRGNPGAGVEPNKKERLVSVFRALVDHAERRRGVDLPLIGKKPYDMLAQISEPHVFASKAEALAFAKAHKADGAKLTTVGRLRDYAAEGSEEGIEAWSAKVNGSLPDTVRARVEALKATEAPKLLGPDGRPMAGNKGAADGYMGRLPVVLMPKPVSLRDLETWQPFVNTYSHAATTAEGADPVAHDMLVALYRDRSRFKVQMPAALRERVGNRQYWVETPGGGREEATGWGAVVKAEAELLDKTEDTLRTAGFPKDMPARRAAASRDAVEQSPTALDANQWRALQSNAVGYTGSRPQDAALDELAAGDAELQALLKLMAAKNNAGSGSAMRYGLPGSERTSEALEATGADPAKLAEQKMLNALGDKRAALTGYESGAAGQAEKDDIIRRMFVPAGTELDILGMLNRAGGSREAIMGKLHPKGAYDMEQMDAIRALLRHTGKGQDLQDMEAALGAARLRAATNQPELRVQGGSSGIPGIGVGTFNSAPVSVVGRVAYPWLRALGSSPSEFPVPGRNQAARFGKGLALRGQPTGLPALGDMIGPERREELKAWLRRNLELTE